MARKRISEFRAKTLLYQELGVQYTGQQITDTHPFRGDVDSDKQYVVKVDQGVKGRFKKGLVKLNQTSKTIPPAIKELREKGYSQFLIEEMTVHEATDEKYIAIERTREGYKILHSQQGGVDIEKQQDSIEQHIIPYDFKPHLNPPLPAGRQVLKGKEKLSPSPLRKEGWGEGEQVFLEKLLHAFDKYYFSFLEINPYVILNTQYSILDTAIEVDSTAAFFSHGAWDESDYTERTTKQKTQEEKQIETLAAKSQAAFSLEVLNQHGSIFMMLSGGGASIVLADEVHNQGYGKMLANYGEYSGNPNAEETYLYAKQILSLLLKSNAAKKVLIIAGGVANFTDIRITFKGLLKALGEKKEDLQKQHIKIFVRRGGPHQKEGLTHMKEFLEKNNLLGVVAGPEMVLTDVVTEAVKFLI